MRTTRKNYDRMNPEDQANVEYADGLLAFEQGHFDDALQYFQKALKRSLLNRSPQYHYALSLLKTGRTKEAIDEFQRFLWRSPLFNPYFDASYIPFSYYSFVYSVKAHYWLGVAYKQQGEKQKAISEYEKFLQIWKDADFKSKELDDARARLTKLKGATSS